MSVVLLAFAVGAAAAAGAQPKSDPRLGTRIPNADDSEWSAYAQPDVRKIQKAFAICVVKKRKSDAERFVLEQSEEARKPLISKVADGNCLVAAARVGEFSMVKMQFSGDFMKYALADALVHLEYATAPIGDFNGVPPLKHEQPDLTKYDPKPGKKLKPAQLQELEEAKTKAVAYAYLAEFGECVVRANPAGAYRLLMTTPETADETEAFSGITPSARNCLDAGKTIALNKATLRGTIAYNYYLLAKAPRTTASQIAGAPK